MDEAGIGKYVQFDLEEEIKFIKNYTRMYNLIINVGIVGLYAVNELTPMSFESITMSIESINKIILEILNFLF